MKRRDALLLGFVVAGAALGVRYVVAAPGGATRGSLSYAGTLLEGGAPMAPPQKLKFQFKKATVSVCSPEVSVAPDATTGAFRATIPLATCPDDLFDGDDVLMTIWLGSKKLVTDDPIEPVPYAKYADFAGGTPGSSKDRPAKSCNALLSTGTKETGRYWVEHPDGTTGAVEVWCEQELDGGGWAMLENSVSGVDTLLFWQIPYAQRLSRFGEPSIGSNFYDGSFYVGGEYMDVYEDLRGKKAIAMRAAADGFETTDMTAINPSNTSDVGGGYGQFGYGWSSSDHDADDYGAGNCSVSYCNVTQHYAGCFNYSLGCDADAPVADGNYGPHVANAFLTAVSLSGDGAAGAFSRVRRITRYVRMVMSKSRATRLAAAAAFGAMVCAVVLAAPGGATRSSLSFAGTLLQDGKPLAGPEDLTFQLRKSALLQCSPVASVSPDSTTGAFNVALSLSSCPDDLFDGSDVTLSIWLGTKKLTGDDPIDPVPYAKYADYAGGTPGSSPERPAASCGALLVTGTKRSGRYWVSHPDGSGTPVEVWCEQEIDGGGWAMLYNSVLGTDTLAFWQFPYADRLGRRGEPTIETNFYDASLYVAGDYIDVIVDLRGHEVVGMHATATGIDTATMKLETPALVSGNAGIYGHFSGGWSSSDYDGDASASNCSVTYSSVAQHYAACWTYNLGSDADGPYADGNVGPHLYTLTATALGLSNDGTAYTRVRRITRLVKW